MDAYRASFAENVLIVHLLGGTDLSVEQGCRPIPDGSKRLVAFLALDRRFLDRPFVAGSLWPDTDDNHAAGCLRTALWRLRQAKLDVVEISRNSLRLSPEVRVDTFDALAWASRVINHETAPQDLRWPELRLEALNLLPGWYDDWLVPYRERLRQRVLHALDQMSALLSEAGRHADAVEAGHVAVSAEPLRESAQRALILAHLAEGNVSEARRAYYRYEDLLLTELGLAPGSEISALVGLAAPIARAG